MILGELMKRPLFPNTHQSLLQWSKTFYPHTNILDGPLAPNLAPVSHVVDETVPEDPMETLPEAAVRCSLAEVGQSTRHTIHLLVEGCF